MNISLYQNNLAISSMMLSGSVPIIYEDKGIAPNTIEINLSYKHSEKYILNSNISVNILNTTSNGILGVYTMELINGGNYAITWDSNIHFVGGELPTLSSNGLIDRLVFISEDGITAECYVVGLDLERH